MHRPPLLLAHTDQRHAGGGERMLLTVARRARRQTPVDLVLLHRGEPRAALTSDPVFTHAHELDAPRDLGLRGAVRLLGSLRAHAALLAGRDACLSFSWPAAVRSALAAPFGGCRLAWFCQEELAARATPRRRAALTWLGRRGTQVVCPSESLRRQLAALGYPPARLTLIRNGVDTTWYRPSGLSGDDKAALRVRLGLLPDALTVLCAARIDRNKRHETLIRAVALAGADVQLVCAGEEHAGAADGRAALARLASDLGVSARVRLLPHQPDLRALLAVSDVAALASLEEAAPLALAEAAATGCALVATRVGGNPELVCDGVTGFLFDPDDAAACARHFALLARSPSLCGGLGRRARERCVAAFSEEQMGAAWDRFIARLLGREDQAC